MQTKAAVLRSANEPMTIETVDLDGPKDLEVLVQIKATSLCRSDYNSYVDATTPVPCILGHEASGVVKEVGSSVTHVAPGDPVLLSWLPYCGECFYCNGSQPQLCSTVIAPLFDGTLMDGSTRFSWNGQKVYHFSFLSSFSEYTVVPAKSCIKMKDGVPFEVASLMGCGVATGFGASVHAGDVQKDSTVAVMGLGGVGIAAIQGARIRGAKNIVGIDVKEVNLAEAKRFGATEAFTPKDKALKETLFEVTDGRGADTVIDASGSGRAFTTGFDLLRNGGTLVVVGAYHDETVSLPAPGMHRKGKIIKGSFYGDVDPIEGFDELFDHYLEGRLDIDSALKETISLDEINRGFETFSDPTLMNTGRTVITF